MNINLTIIGQFITFVILVWFTMKYVWPPIIKAIHEREKKIAQGLADAERSRQELEMAEHKASSIIREAKQQATQIIEHANLHSTQLVEEAKSQAKHESQRIIDLAEDEITKEATKVRESLKKELAKLAITGAEKIIQRNLDLSAQQDLLNQLANEI